MIVADTPAFLELPFDWFVLEQWRGPREGETRQHEQLRLATEYAKLGYRGRRRHVIQARRWGNSEIIHAPRETIALPRAVTEVPQDLLTAFERRQCDTNYHHRALLVRTDYGEGTEQRFKRIVECLHDAYWSALRSGEGIADDPTYGLQRLLPDLYAHFPCLVDSVSLPKYNESEQWEPFDGADLQKALYGDHNLPEDDRKVWARSRQIFVADPEAMRSGMLLWLEVDEYGVPVILERIQPASVRDIVACRYYKNVEEWRRQIPELQEAAPYEFVAPWTEATTTQWNQTSTA